MAKLTYVASTSRDGYIEDDEGQLDWASTSGGSGTASSTCTIAALTGSPGGLGIGL